MTMTPQLYLMTILLLGGLCVVLLCWCASLQSTVNTISIAPKTYRWLSVEQENTEWYIVDEVRGPVRLPVVIDGSWLSDPRVWIKRIKGES